MRRTFKVVMLSMAIMAPTWPMMMVAATGRHGEGGVASGATVAHLTVPQQSMLAVVPKIDEIPALDKTGTNGGSEKNDGSQAPCAEALASHGSFQAERAGNYFVPTLTLGLLRGFKPMSFLRLDLCLTTSIHE